MFILCVYICFKISNATELLLNNNPAYAIKTTHQRDLAYEVTSISTGEPQTSQAATNELEPTYETVQLSQQSSVQMPSSRKDEDDYDKLNRDLPLTSTEGVIRKHIK